MKSFKKLAAIGAAGFLAVSAGIFAGCDNSGDDGDGGNELGGNQNFSSEAETLIKALDGSPDYLGFDMALKTTDKYKSSDTYHNNSSQDYNYEESEIYNINAKGKFNVKSGNGDVIIYESHHSDDWYSANWDYVFLRNYQLFATDEYYRNEADDAEITDFSDCVLDCVELEDDWLYWIFKAAGIDMDLLLPEETSALSATAYDSSGNAGNPSAGPDNPSGSIATISPIGILYYLVLNDVTLSDANVLLIALADAAGAVSVNGNAVTLDINKLAYQLAQDAKAVLNSIDEYTTVSALLQNSIVKKWIKALTAFIDFDDVREAVEEVLQPLLKEEFDYNLPAADEKDDVYSYLMKLINDTAFATKVLGIPTALGALSVEGVLDMIDEDLDLDAVKEYVGQYTKDITPTVFEFTFSDSWGYDDWTGKRQSEEEGTVTASGAKIIYTLSGNKVTKMEATCENIAYKANGQREDWRYDESHENLLPYETTVWEQDKKFEFRLTVDYAAQAYTLANIDDCFVHQVNYVYTDESQSSIAFANGLDEYGHYVSSRLMVTLKANNGEATGFIFEDEDGDSATLNGLNGGTVTLGDETYTISVEERSYGLSLKFIGVYDIFGYECSTSFSKTAITTETETVKDLIG